MLSILVDLPREIVKKPQISVVQVIRDHLTTNLWGIELFFMLEDESLFNPRVGSQVQTTRGYPFTKGPSKLGRIAASRMFLFLPIN